MLPIIIGLAAATTIAVGRAAFRARTRLNKLPPSVFGIIDTQHDTKAPFLMGGFGSQMTYAEALDILGLPPNPSKDDLVTAHRKVMLANHPDRGGSTYMALKINQAKDVIQKHL